MDFITNWLGACGSKHIGLYTCSKCGFELLRSSFEKDKGFIKSATSNISSMLPPSTIAAKGRNITSSSFDSSMLPDFTKNFLLGRMLHKNSLMVTEISEAEPTKGVDRSMIPSTLEISCGKCGSSLGQQIVNGENSRFRIRPDSIDLTFRPS